MRSLQHVVSSPQRLFVATPRANRMALRDFREAQWLAGAALSRFRHALRALAHVLRGVAHTLRGFAHATGLDHGHQDVQVVQLHPAPDAIARLHGYPHVRNL